MEIKNGKTVLVFPQSGSTDLHPCRKMEDMTTEVIMEHLISVLNSNEDVPIDSSSHIVLGAIKYPRGGKGSKLTSLHEKIAKKKSIVRIENKDNLCLVRVCQCL